MNRTRRIHISFIFLVTLLCYVWIFPRWADPNQNSRLNMVVAVVDDGTFQIDRYVANTVDYAKVGDHYYSDKAPGAAFLGIPLYAVLTRVLDLPVVNAFSERLAQSDAFASTLRETGSGVSTEKVRFAITQLVLSLLVSALPSALLCALLFVVAERMTGSTPAAIVTALAYGLLSPAMPYANTFMGHQLAAALLFAAFALLYLAPARMGPVRLLLVGLLLGYAVVTEYPAFLPAALIFLYAVVLLARRGRVLATLYIVASGLAVAGLWMSYNTVVFGAPLELGYSHSELWVDEHSTGFMSLTTPTLAAFWGITFSPFRGLFLLAPWLLLALPGYAVWWRWRTSLEERAAWLTSLLCVISIFVFNSSSGMWWGGFAVGPRYLLPMLPFLALGSAFAFAAWGRALGFRILAVCLLLWSFVAVWSMTVADQAFPSDAFRNPWASHVLPAWQQGNLARNLGTIVGLEHIWAYLPLFGLLALLGAAWWWIVQRSHATLDVVHPVSHVTAPER